MKAVQQSRRAKVPSVQYLHSFEEALKVCEGDGLKILLWEKGGEKLKPILRQHHSRRIFAMVGPEGGFADGEADLAKARGFVLIKLGQRILRTETAAIALVGILQYELGDLT